MPSKLKDDGVKLKVNGTEYAGWKSARVTRSIESVAGSFELSVSDRWANQDQLWPIRQGDECQIVIGPKNEPVITGYVDRRSMSLGADDHSVSLGGRDKTGLLVDCSAVLKSWEFKNLDLLTLVQRIADPFGLYVVMDDSVGGARVTLSTGKSGGSVSGAGKGGKLGGLSVPKPPKKFSVNPGESCFEVIDRACRAAGVLPVSDGQGGLVLTRAGTAQAVGALVEGTNILAAQGEFDASNRYHRYVVLGQQAGNDWLTGKATSSVKAEAIDEQVGRTERTLVIRPEGSLTPESAKQRAAWEATVRAARAASISVTVQGWTMSNGEIWPVNSLVSVCIPSLELGTEVLEGTACLVSASVNMLITQTEFNLDESGTTTRLTLKRPDAFLPEPVIPQESKTKPWEEIKRGV